VEGSQALVADQQAHLGAVVSEFEFTPGTHFIRVRATDSDGVLQAKGPKNPAPNGAEGWHQVNFRVTDG